MNFLSEMQLLQKWCLIPENNITSPEESVQHMVCALAGDILPATLGNSERIQEV